MLEPIAIFHWNVGTLFPVWRSHVCYTLNVEIESPVKSSVAFHLNTSRFNGETFYIEWLDTTNPRTTTDSEVPSE